MITTCILRYSSVDNPFPIRRVTDEEIRNHRWIRTYGYSVFSAADYPDERGKGGPGAYGDFTQGFKVDVPFVIPSLGNLSAIMKLGITDIGSSWGVVIPKAEEDPAYGNYEANISISKGTMNVYAGNQLNLDGQGDVSIKTIGKISIGDSDGIVNIGGIENIAQALRSLILVRTQERQNLSQNAGADDFWNFASLGEVAGYTRIISNVSISGTMSSFMNHYQTNYNSDNTSIRVKNLSTQAFRGNIRVTCLYVREGFYER